MPYISRDGKVNGETAEWRPASPNELLISGKIPGRFLEGRGDTTVKSDRDRTGVGAIVFRRYHIGSVFFKNGKNP